MDSRTIYKQNERERERVNAMCSESNYQHRREHTMLSKNVMLIDTFLLKAYKVNYDITIERTRVETAHCNNFFAIRKELREFPNVVLKWQRIYGYEKPDS